MAGINESGARGLHLFFLKLQFWKHRQRIADSAQAVLKRFLARMAHVRVHRQADRRRMRLAPA